MDKTINKMPARTKTNAINGFIGSSELIRERGKNIENTPVDNIKKNNIINLSLFSLKRKNNFSLKSIFF